MPFINNHFRVAVAILATLGLLLGIPNDAQAVNTIDQVLQVTATASTSQPYITLSWPAVTGASGADIKIYRRTKGTASWGTAMTVSSTATTFEDNTASPGIAYEYSLQCALSASPYTKYGAICVASNLPLVESRGKVCLIVDTTMTTSLSCEIAQLQKNLVADGWIIYRHDVARPTISASDTNTASYATRLAERQAIRTIVQNDYNSAPGTDWALFLLGRIPVPYSGYTAPDGHGDHSGAWPTDLYYADVNGTWTDTSTNSATSVNDQRNRNVAGDGKFDQSSTPSTVEMQCGRVDMASMISEPVGINEAELLRQYLVRDHNFRRGLPPYDNVARRGYVIDFFPSFAAGEAFAASGWNTSTSLFGRGTGKTDSSGSWFVNLPTTPVLYAYGCGAGSFQSGSGLGFSYYDYNKKDSKAVFVMQFGSYFGDWDYYPDGLLRSVLAGTANSLGLCNMWSGRPYCHYEHLGIGETLGYCARFTQNNPDYTGTGGWRSGPGGSITINLMGDPTLRLHTIRPPTKVTATSTSSGITINWIASTDTTLSGYHVYRSTSVSGPFTRITGSPAIVNATTSNPTGSCLSTSTLTYTDTDSALVAGTSYTYLVKAVRMESSPSGTYANQSLGEAVTLTHLAATPAPAAPTRLVVTRTGTNSCTLTWDDNSSDETGFQIERRNPSGGAWSLLTTAAANATTYTDSSATVGQIVHYRVRAAGAANSAYTNEVADYNRPGLVYASAHTYVTAKSAQTASIPIVRFNGSAGATSITYTTADILGTAGTDYTATNTTVSWSHGQSGTQTASVPVTNVSGNQLTKIVKVTLGNPLNGLTYNTPTLSYLFITDPAATTLPSPWATTTFGIISTSQPGYAEYVNGTFGMAVCGGAINSWQGDSYRMIYQSVSGDFQMTARVSFLSNLVGGNRAGVIARNLLSSDSAGASVQRTNTTSAAFPYRTANGGSNVMSVTSSGLTMPGWVRLTRSGNNLTGYTSSDGNTWATITNTTAISGLTSSLYVGLALTSSTAADSGTITGPQAYARFDNVTLYTVPAAVATLTASTTSATQSGQIVLTWTASSAATSYLVERSTSSGSGFSQIGNSSTNSYTDTALTAGTTYFYRVKAINPAYQASAYSPVASATPFLPASAAGWNYTYFGSESSTGNAAPAADPDGDGIPNLIEYALGLNPTVANNATTLPSSQTQTIAADKFLTYTFVRNKNAADLTFSVEVSNDPATGWTSLDPLAAVNQYSVTDNSPAAGLQTITVKDSQPLSSSPRRFMRLKVSVP